jgi:hypothetical protein
MKVGRHIRSSANRGGQQIQSSRTQRRVARLLEKLSPIQVIRHLSKTLGQFRFTNESTVRQARRAGRQT